MSQPVKLSDELILEARIAAKEQERSIAGQVEHWAKLGRSIDSLLDGRAQRSLRASTAVKPLSQLLGSVEKAEGRARLRAYLESEPFPHFEAHPTRKGYLICTDEDGDTSVGRFVSRQFVIDRKDEHEEKNGSPAVQKTARRR